MATKEKEVFQFSHHLLNVWQNPKFQSENHKPRLTQTAARPLLDYSGRIIVELRQKHRVETPLTGRADQYLLINLEKSLNIEEFVRNLIIHALQTGDGDQLVPTKEIDEAMRKDPPVFSSESAIAEAKGLTDRIDQLLDNLSNPLSYSSREYSDLDVICRKLKNVEYRCIDADKKRTEEIEKEKKSPGKTEGVQSHLGRTSSEEANIQVQNVRSHLSEKASPLNELRKSLSLIQPEEVLNKKRRMMRLLRKKGRDFHEDLMNLLFTLDDLRVRDEPTIGFRRDTIEKVQDMLDELENITTEMDKVVIRAEPAEQQQEPQQEGQKAQTAAQTDLEKPQPQQEQAPGDIKSIDWAKLKLSLRFESRTTPQAYLLLASLANLDLKSLKLTVSSQENTLRLEGYRPPEEIEKTEFEKCRDVFTALAAAQGRVGTFKEEFQLPKDVMTSEIYAEYNRGNLRVVIPRNLSERSVESIFGFPNDFFEGEFWW
jgi:HSP20 family molecular chaperone IbpA